MAMNDVLVRIDADVSNYTKSINRASAKLESFGRTATTIGATAAKAFGAMATGGAVAIGATVKQASDFESAFTGVRKTVDASEKQFGALKKGILDMSKVMPQSASEIAGVAEVAGQLGIKQKDILKFTKTMVMMGDATNMSASEAASQLARFANITGMSMDEIDNLGATVVDLGNNLATTESEITTMGLRLAGAGHQVGMTESDILSFAGALSSVGIEAEAGGTAFSRVMLNIQTATMNGGKKLEGFAKVAGMSAGDFKTAFKDDAAGAMMEFISGLGKMSDKGDNVTGTLDDLGLGEIRVRDALLRASNASGLFTEALNTGKNAWKENTALTDEASKRYETFASKMKMLWNRINDVLIIIGEPLMDALLNLLEAGEPLIEFIEGLAEKFANSNEQFQQFVAIGAIVGTLLATLAAGIGIALVVVGQLALGLGALAAALGTTVGALLAVTGVVAAVVAGVAAIVAAVVIAYNKFYWFKNAVDKTWSAVKSATSAAFNFIKQIITQVIGAVVSFASAQLAKFQALWNKHSSTIMSIVTGAFSTIKTVIQSAMQFIQGVFQVVWPIMSGLVQTAWGVIKTVIGSAIDVVVGLIDAGMSIITGNWTGAWEAIRGIAENIVGNIIDFFSGIDLFDIGSNIISGLVNGISSMKDAAINTVKKVGSNIKSTLTSFFNIHSPSRVMRDEVGKMIGLGLIKGMDGQLSPITKMANNVAKAAKPDMPKLAGFTDGNMRADMQSHSDKLTSEMQANVSHSDSRVEEILTEMNKELRTQSYELRKQKQMIVEMDGRAVGRAVEPEVTRKQKRDAYTARQFRG